MSLLPFILCPLSPPSPYPLLIETSPASRLPYPPAASTLGSSASVNNNHNLWMIITPTLHSIYNNFPTIIIILPIPLHISPLVLFLFDVYGIVRWILSAAHWRQGSVIEKPPLLFLILSFPFYFPSHVYIHPYSPSTSLCPSQPTPSSSPTSRKLWLCHTEEIPCSEQESEPLFFYYLHHLKPYIEKFLFSILFCSCFFCIFFCPFILFIPFPF